MAAKQHPAGAHAERLAVKFLRRMGLRIVERNYSCQSGEIDLIALDGREVVFVEVKSLSDGAFEASESKVDRDKRKRISRTALDYCRRHGLEDVACRFDVVSVLAPHTKTPTIRHIPSAFPLQP